jgi:hypothetical protein
MNIVLEIIIFNVVVFTICGINMAKKGRLGLIQEYPKAIQDRCRGKLWQVDEKGNDR